MTALHLLSPSDLERFWYKVQKTSDCWMWTDVTPPNGYGYLSVGGRKGRRIQAHRIAYEIANGSIPAGLHIDHLCRVRNCVNPSHLEPVTNKENTLRGESPSAKNAVKTHCAKGHPYSPDNTAQSSKGGRACRICQKEWSKKTKMKARHPEKFAKEYPASTTRMVEQGLAIHDVLQLLELP